MHSCQYGTQLFRITFRNRTYCPLVLGCRELYKIKSIFTAFGIESISGARVLELDCGAYIACTQFVHGVLNLTAHTIYLSDSLFCPSVYVIQIHARSESSAHYFKIAHLAYMRFYCCLEHIQAQRSVAVRLNLLSFCIDRSRHVFNKRHNISQKFHHATHTHVLERAYAEHREYRPVYKTFSYTFTHFILCQMTLVEEFFHKSLVILGGSLYQLLMKCESLLFFLFRYIFYYRHSTIRSP